MNTVTVKRGFKRQDFKAGQFVVEAEDFNPEELVVYCVDDTQRSDGILPCRLMEPPFTKMTYPRAEDMEPFYGTIVFESKP